MKYLLLLLLLTLVLVSNAAVVPNVPSQNINVGTIQPGDRIVHRSSIRISYLDRLRFHDYVYSSNAFNEMTAVFVTEVDNTPFAAAWVVDGGIGFNNIRIRMQFRFPYGCHYSIEIWGR